VSNYREAIFCAASVTSTGECCYRGAESHSGLEDIPLAHEE